MAEASRAKRVDQALPFSLLESLATIGTDTCFIRRRRLACVSLGAHGGGVTICRPLHSWRGASSVSREREKGNCEGYM